MRNLPDERLSETDGTDGGGPSRAAPIRKCVLSGERAGQATLIRLALAPDGRILPDIRAKAPGRGAWIGVDRATLTGAYAKGRLRGALSRAFKTGAISVPDDLPQRIADALERATLDRLGLEARAGNVATGSERIETAARSGKLRLLLHASDAGTDGCRRLAQAWRVGSGREGSDLAGLVLPLPRAILSLALGRENVVHIGLTDPEAARRTRATLDRWLYFIGSDPDRAPCETASQGSLAAAARGAGMAETTHEDFE